MLGIFLTAMTTSGASYITTRESVSKELAVQDEKLNSLEQTLYNNAVVHKDIAATLKELSETNTQMQISLTRIATIVELKVQGDG